MKTVRYSRKIRVKIRKMFADTLHCQNTRAREEAFKKARVLIGTFVDLNHDVLWQNIYL